MNTLTNTLTTHISRALIALALIFSIVAVAIPTLASEWIDPNPTTVSFTLYKYVIGDQYPDGEHPSIPDFTFHLDGPINTSMKSGETIELPPGTYILTETSPQGFVLQKWGGDCDEASGTTDSEDSELIVDADLVSTNVNLSCQVYNEIDENNPPQINGTLVVNKVVVNDNGGQNLADDFFFKVNGGTSIAFEADGSNAISVPAGSYTVTEPAAPGYTTTYSGCSGIAVGSASTSICTITNNDIAPGTTTPQNAALVVKKVVINDNGGTGTSSNFSFQVNGGTTTAFEVDGSNSVSVPPGTYTVTETAAAGYTTTYSGCTNVALAASGTATCTITNNDVAPGNGTLIVNKVVVNNQGGTGTSSNFSFQINGGTSTAFEADGSNAVTLPAGTYTVTEVAAVGYTPSYQGCTRVALTANGTTTCTITNDDLLVGTGTLTVNKVVINDNGGTGTTSNFSFQVNGGTSIAFEVDGTNTIALAAGTYDITEVAASGYTTSYAGCSGVVITADGSATCTITNNDIASGGGGGDGGGGGNGGGGGSGKKISLGGGGGSNNNNDDDDEDEPEGEVAGAVAPIGAPNAGAGGAGTGTLATTLMLLLGLAISAATGRRIA